MTDGVRNIIVQASAAITPSLARFDARNGLSEVAKLISFLGEHDVIAGKSILENIF